MSYPFRGVLFIVFLCLSMIACEKDDTTINNPIDDVAMHYESIELEITDLVNNYRAQNGLPKLNVLNLVSKEAETHSIYMLNSGTISHDNFDERTRNLIEQIDALSVGENVAFGYKSAQSLLEGWLNSPTHRRVIEGKSYTDFGIAAEKNSNGSYYVTQIFIERE